MDVGPPSTEFEVLAHFEADGCRLTISPPVVDARGNVYGVTAFGGGFQGGCLYQVPPKGGLRILYEFKTNTPDEGFMPWGDLRLEADGSLLGTTQWGGRFGGGTLFRVETKGGAKGVPQFLAHFRADALGPLNPNGAPILAQDGRLYGCARGGPYRGGVVYSANPDGSDFRVVHSFGRPGEPIWPATPLVQAPDGKLYGTLTSGPDDRNAGGIFMLRPDGTKSKVLHIMETGDGRNPEAGPVLLSDGSLIGTNSVCGRDDSWCDDGGTIFRLSGGPLAARAPGEHGKKLGQSGQPSDSSKGKAPSFEVLYVGGGSTYAPKVFRAGLVVASDGSYWGMSTFGGNFPDYGAVYRFDPVTRVMQTMHSFHGADGMGPKWALAKGPDGWLYGVTSQGGDGGQGVVFRIRTTEALGAR